MGDDPEVDAAIEARALKTATTGAARTLAAGLQAQPHTAPDHTGVAQQISSPRCSSDVADHTAHLRRAPPGERRALADPRARRRAVEATPLDAFLTARWALHSRFYGGTAIAQISYPAWPLRSAELPELDTAGPRRG